MTINIPIEEIRIQHSSKHLKLLQILFLLCIKIFHLFLNKLTKKLRYFIFYFQLDVTEMNIIVVFLPKFTLRLYISLNVLLKICFFFIRYPIYFVRREKLFCTFVRKSLRTHFMSNWWFGMITISIVFMTFVIWFFDKIEQDIRRSVKHVLH